MIIWRAARVPEYESVIQRVKQRRMWIHSIGNSHGAVKRAIGFPKLKAMNSVIGGEVQQIIERYKRPVREASCPRAHITDHLGAGGGAIGSPELATMHTIVCKEKHQATDN